MKNNNFDFGVFTTVLIMLCLGLLMVFSASTPTSYSSYSGDIYYIFKKQLLFAVIGFVFLIIVMNIDYHFYTKISLPLLIFSAALLIMTKIPGLSYSKGDASRWIKIGSQTLQPSELVKFTIILFISGGMATKINKTGKPPTLKDIYPYLIVVVFYLGVLVSQPHLSATVIIISSVAILLFIAGLQLRYFISLILAAILGMIIIISKVEYAKARIFITYNPFLDPLGLGYQNVQSLYAIGSGGFFGRGFGRSMQKFLYIPEPQNDFIFAIMAEELGFIGVLAFMLVLFILVWRGMKIALNAKDKLGSFLAGGITSLIFIQTAINIGVVTSVIPNTGISLPFFSSGGTALLMFLIEIGVLLNISKQSNYKKI